MAMTAALPAAVEESVCRWCRQRSMGDGKACEWEKNEQTGGEFAGGE